MVSTFFPIVTMLNDVHSLKADSPISLTESGIAICVKFEHLKKADVPIVCTLLGIAILLIFAHPKNAALPIFTH